MELWEKVLEDKTIYKGKIFDVEVKTVRLPDGRESVREIVKHPGAVVVVPVTDDGRVILVRQFRLAAGNVMLEIPAGKIEPGEKPEAGARRELEEETGYRCRELVPLFSYYSSPGFTDEKMHIYLARGLEQGTAGGDEDEFIEIEERELGDLVNEIYQGKISDGKTVSGILGAYYWLQTRT